MMTKPPPPPPSHAKAALPMKVDVVHSHKQMERYQLPMASEYTPAWVAVLEACSYPTEVAVLDFETYFDDEYGMPALSTVEYIQDKRFEVLGLAHVTMNGSHPFQEYESRSQMALGEEAVARFLKGMAEQYGPELSGVTVVIQNATFDASVLMLRYGVRPKYLIDTLALGRAWNARSKNDLDTQAKRFGLPPKGDTKNFSGCTLRRGRYIRSKSRGKTRPPPVPRPLMTDEQQLALIEYATNDVNREWEVFTILLPKLSNPRFELRVQHHTLEMFTQPVMRVDEPAARDLIGKMNAHVDSIIRGVMDLYGETWANLKPEDAGWGVVRAVLGKQPGMPIESWKEVISRDTTFEALLIQAVEDAGDNPQTYYKACKRGFMLALAKDDPQKKLLQGHTSPVVRKLIAARSALDSWPLHIKRVERIVRMALAVGGAMPVPLKYWGAHTGRWSGGEKINLQNLPRQGDPLVVAIKGLIVAMLGWRLVIVDAAAIEARVLAWVAGQWDLVEAFAAKRDVYCDMAATMFGYKVRKARKDDIPSIADRYTKARQAGKVVILGSGYGMGSNALVDYAGSQGVPMTSEEAAAATKAYREKNSAIVAFWKTIEKAFVYTAKYKRPCSLERGISFYSRPDCDVVMVLPNGRELKYLKVRVEQGQWGEDRASVYNETEHHWDHLWGGTLTENAVQAISRDVLIESGMRMEDRGYHVAHHVHDELILHVPEDQAEACLSLTIAEMSKTPEWAPRLPLSAEGVVSDRYGKH